MGFLMYIVVPAVGPVHCMTEYPQQLSAPIPQPGVRNCFPSLHFSWALLMFAYARTRWTTILASAFVGMTVLATLGLGEHYLADLIVALPFAALVVLLERDRCLSRSSGLALAAVLLLTVVACAPLCLLYVDSARNRLGFVGNRFGVVCTGSQGKSALPSRTF